MTMNDTRPKWPFQHITTMAAHPGGQWVKKVRGKIRYFGAWANPDPDNAKAKAAIDKYMNFMRATDNGEQDLAQPLQVVRPEVLNLDTMVNGFMGDKHRSVESGDLSARQFAEYRKLGNLILSTLGKQRLVCDLSPADFATIRSKLPGGPVRLGNEVVWVRSFFRWASDHHGVAVRFGNQLDKPARRVVRKAVKRKDIFHPVEIKAILAKATPAIKAMILLGINAGFGQTDCATLPVSAVNLNTNVIEFDRHKTGIRRTVPLWPETVKALKEYVRPCTAHPELFFITRWGNPWVHDEVHRDTHGIIKNTVRCDAVDLEFDKAQKAAGLAIRGFYLLRHTFRSVADPTGDLNAIRGIMGHAFPGMDEFYLHLNSGGIERLSRVTDYVRTWLFGPIRKSAKRRAPAKNEPAKSDSAPSAV
jgi:integrase